jgi:hypothetical protein
MRGLSVDDVVFVVVWHFAGASSMILFGILALATPNPPRPTPTPSHFTCGSTHPGRLQAQRNSWLKSAAKVVLMSQQGETSAADFVKALVVARTHFPDAKWYILGDDDSYMCLPSSRKDPMVTFLTWEVRPAHPL